MMPGLTIMEHYRAQDTPKRMAKYLLVPEKKSHFFDGFTTEWIDTCVPGYFSGHFEAQSSSSDALDKDDSFWDASKKRKIAGLNAMYDTWKGIVKVTRGPDVLYYCASQCCNGNGFTDLNFIAFARKEFFEEFMALLLKADSEEPDPTGLPKIFCANGPDIELEDVAFDRVVLPEGMKQDIISSTEVFFKRTDAFNGIGVPSKRGFLLTGEPGNGKTLMCHALANHASKNFKVRLATLCVNNNTDNDDIRELYDWSSIHGPAMIFLEDVDTIMTQTRVTRSGFLNVLDGMRPERGVLTIATTNYPEKLDPALAHRPSRFDRVWRIPQPGDNEREIFLRKLFADMDADLCNTVVRKTKGWSMAYVQELKATAIVRAVQNDRSHIAQQDIEEAVKLMGKQFKSGKKNHQVDEGDPSIGFGVA